jgi:hypothetical protein
MLYTLKNNTIKIDMGDHYYSGEVIPEMFPEEIRDNYLEIVEQSFNDYSDEQCSVSHLFENKEYIINFTYKSKPFCFKRTIKITMEQTMKDFRDYTNERIEGLENQIAELKQMVIELKDEKFALQMIRDTNSEDEDDDEEEDEEEDDEEKEEEKEPVNTKAVLTKGGKKVAAVVQLATQRKR